MLTSACAVGTTWCLDIRCMSARAGKRFAMPQYATHFSYDNMRAVEWRVRTVMWICAVQWVTCGANAPDRIAGALQMNTQPCLNGTGNNLVHRGFDRAFGIGAQESADSARR